MLLMLRLVANSLPKKPDKRAIVNIFIIKRVNEKSSNKNEYCFFIKLNKIIDAIIAAKLVPKASPFRPINLDNIKLVLILTIIPKTRTLIGRVVFCKA